MSNDQESWGILSDTSVRDALKGGAIQIEPFVQEQLSSASYDVTLGEEVAVYDGWVDTGYDPAHEEGVLSSRRKERIEDGRFFTPLDYVYDVKTRPSVQKFIMDPEVGWVVKPGIGYLMHTRERILTSQYVPILDGKSSIGRLFIMVHVTAGYGDPSFDGQFTLEVKSTHPVRIYPGMKIGQIRFHTIHGKVENPYSKIGHYKGEAARGAVASQAWLQFTKRVA